MGTQGGLIRLGKSENVLSKVVEDHLAADVHRASRMRHMKQELPLSATLSYKAFRIGLGKKETYLTGANRGTKLQAKGKFVVHGSASPSLSSSL